MRSMVPPKLFHTDLVVQWRVSRIAFHKGLVPQYISPFQSFDGKKQLKERILVFQLS